MSRLVPFYNLPDWCQNQLLLTDSGDAQIVEDDHGTLRYKAKPIMRWLADQVDLNKLWLAYQEGTFPIEELLQFYRDMGYSLSGFAEVFAEHLDRLEEQDNEIY